MSYIYTQKDSSHFPSEKLFIACVDCNLYGLYICTRMCTLYMFTWNKRNLETQEISTTKGTKQTSVYYIWLLDYEAYSLGESGEHFGLVQEIWQLF